MARKITGAPITVRGKRIQSVMEILEEIGVNPATEIIRNAYKAEKAGQYGIAVNAWDKLLAYVHHKMKAIDPTEQLEKQSKALSLLQLQHMKEAIYAGVIAEIKPESIIDQAKPDPLESLFNS